MVRFFKPSSGNNAASASDMNAWQAFGAAYFNREALSMLLLGFAAGVPLMLIFSTLGLWLREAGIDRTTVTMFSWAALGYSFKFIWSPLVDTLPLPALRGLLGHRRSWLLFTQVMIITAIVCMAMTNPVTHTPSIMAMAAVFLGFSSATQDIVIDAYRIEIAPKAQQAALSASYVGGYRVGMIASGAGALYLASFFGSTEASYSYMAWQKTYLVMACVMLVGVFTTLFVLREPVRLAKKVTTNTHDYARLVAVFVCAVIAFILAYRTVGASLPEVESVMIGFLLGCVQFIVSAVAMGLTGLLLVKAGLVKQEIAVATWVKPITDFFERYGKQAILLLALIGLYRVSDIVAGNISNLFYQDLGFTKIQIANTVKTFGLIATIAGGFVGGWLAQKLNIMKAMMIGAILACTTNLLFVLLFFSPTSLMMYGAVLVDNLSAGLASAVFIAFLSALTSIRFTAVQYALFSSLMTLSPKILGGYSGAIVDATSYPVFFIITFALGIPVLLLIYLVNQKIPLQLNDDTDNTP